MWFLSDNFLTRDNFLPPPPSNFPRVTPLQGRDYSLVQYERIKNFLCNIYIYLVLRYQQQQPTDRELLRHVIFPWLARVLNTNHGDVSTTDFRGFNNKKPKRTYYDDTYIYISMYDITTKRIVPRRTKSSRGHPRRNKMTCKHDERDRISTSKHRWVLACRVPPFRSLV